MNNLVDQVILESFIGGIIKFAILIKSRPLMNMVIKPLLYVTKNFFINLIVVSIELETSKFVFKNLIPRLILILEVKKYNLHSMLPCS